MRNAIRINEQRYKSNFEALARIGQTPEGGVHRPALSEAHLAARSWYAGMIRASGLELRQDSAGNHSAFLNCGKPNSRTLFLGSHLDSVPYGGRFDGALGVIAAFEALLAVQENRIELPVNLEAIDFTDEEGTLIGLLGSAALSGHLSRVEVENPRGGRAELLSGLERAGLTETGLFEAARDPSTLAGYLELHIEQGPRLSKAGVQIGVVSGIIGICSYRLAFTGRADHAGTTPMDDRLDAALGAASFITRMHETLRQAFPGCVANTGWVQTLPGAFNIVPARAEISLELRSPDPDQFKRLENSLLSIAGEQARFFGLGFEHEFLGRHQPVPLSAAAQGAVQQACQELGMTSIPLTSGAGHDAQMLAPLCPSGMIFIPSEGGSHSGREFAAWEDCCNGANVLLQSALKLADMI